MKMGFLPGLTKSRSLASLGMTISFARSEPARDDNKVGRGIGENE
jgi:hypothetical protein